MSPRRVFATPFVITLAASPAAAEDTSPGHNPPVPHDQRWQVRRDATDKKLCWIPRHSTCPPAEPGKPRRTCNPPPPQRYACPDNVREDEFTVVQAAGAKTCHVEDKPVTCKPGATCNPPPPRVVPCP